MRTLLLLVPLCLAQARITRIVIDRTESPTFRGESFGEVGPYEKIIGRAFGEISPFHPLNNGITDLMLAPRPGGYVQYSTTFYLLKPVDKRKGNGLLFYSAPNRGDKRAFSALNQGLSSSNDPTATGDGLAMRRGYSMLWSGWQADVEPGNDRLTLNVPIARNPDGSDVTGPVRMELIPTAVTSTWNYALYPPVDAALSHATLTLRQKEGDVRLVVPRSDWVFADCSRIAFPGTPSPTSLCVKGGFQPDLIYEFIYTAKDPLVLGIGLAATRDLVSFFRYFEADDTGTPNPLAGAITAAIGEGQSQAGRFIRTFLDLGFNQDEYRNLIFDGLQPHIAGQGIPVNVRFGQPDRASGQRENALYPSPDSPPTWGPMVDPLAGRLAGNADACRETLSCPKIIHTVSSTEFWQGRMSLNITDPLGRGDAQLPDFVRLYHFASTQHTPTTSNSTGICQQLQNPAPFFELRRALLLALERWVLAGVPPPASRYPTLREGTLVAPGNAGWPSLPGVRFNGLLSTMNVRDYGIDFDARRLSGIVANEPPIVGKAYTMLVPKVDADGNELGGLRSPTITAPRGTYTGWALRRAGFGEDELCGLTGSYVPFRAARAERLAAGDPRLSLEERYPTTQSYANAVELAVQALLRSGYLLPEDAARLIAAARP